jgi:mono/diheme cytochrome c family protein
VTIQSLRPLSIAIAGFVLALAAPGALVKSQTRNAKPTFAEHIAPILYANCVGCHRPGEAAPFSLVTYDEVVKRAKLVTEVTSSKYMPPWQAVHGYGDFVGARGLSDAQIQTIGDWVKGGMPRGDSRRIPKLPQFAEGWQLGVPDVILEMPASYEVPADGPDIYRNFVLPTGLSEDKWIRAVEFRPGARKAVHHALFQFVRGGTLSKDDGKDGQPGFRGLTPVAFFPGLAPSGDLGGWTVGATPQFLPAGLARLMPKGSDLVLQIHFHPTGKVERERSTVGLYFADKPSERRIMTPAVPGLFGLLARIDIPPGEKDYTIKGVYNVAVDMRAISVDAHAHYLGKEIKATATMPDGSTKPLLWIKDWDFNWQDRYTYREPVVLPKGTRIDVTISYDNSADNPQNPHDPPRRVMWGVQSTQEMGVVRFEMIAERQEDEAVLQQLGAAAVKAALAQLAKDGTLKQYLQEAQRVSIDKE